LNVLRQLSHSLTWVSVENNLGQGFSNCGSDPI